LILNCDKAEVAGTDQVAPVGKIYPFVLWILVSKGYALI